MKKELIFVFAILFLIGILPNINSQSSETTYCAERTLSGAWCQNVPIDQVDTNYRSIPSSCESSSFCRKGYCFDSQEGTCASNTAQATCQENGGVWEEDNGEPPLQCQLGCCILGDQASFVSQTRCKRLSSLYGVETNYRTDIQNEAQCILSVSNDVKGACVFEEDFERTCKFTTQRECVDLGAGITPEESDSAVRFYEGTLCSDETLATNCGPTQETTCVEDEDMVYFVDSCGNLANIYDASKINDKNYWAEVYDPTESCGFGQSNSDSQVCGNCNYFLGSTCKEFDRGEDEASPRYGDFICRDLSCEYEGQTYFHGETWCADSAGVDEALPGSRHFRLSCYDGDVTVEACADFRQEVCIQSEVGDFSNAACRVNKWQDCYAQDNEVDCNNIDRRDCQWVEDIILSVPNFEEEGNTGERNQQTATGSQNEENIQAGITGNSILGGDDGYSVPRLKLNGACVPLNAPGFDFWQPETQAKEFCFQASTQCIVKFEETLTGSRECTRNCHCLEDDFEEQMKNACIAIGDCGSSTNYIGIKGYHNGTTISTEDYEVDGEDDGGLLGGLLG